MSPVEAQILFPITKSNHSTQSKNGSAIKQKIATILSPFEKNTFFPKGFPSDILGAPVEIFTPAEVGDMADFLHRIHPSIVVGGWDMPPLPDINNLPIDKPLPFSYLCFLTGTVRKKVSRTWLERGLLVTNWGDSISRVVAESALMMILCSLRDVARYQSIIHLGGWKSTSLGESSLFAKKVGLHGFGRIAQSLAELLKPFGVSLITYAPGTPKEILDKYSVTPCATLEDLFRQSSILVELAPLNPQTKGIVTRKLLSLLPRKASFINVGRGAVVNESDLVEVALERDLRIALDVYEKEPLPTDSPLRRHPQFLLMPHQAGPTLDRCPDAGSFALEQMKTYLEGGTPKSILTPEIWDVST